MLVHTARTDRGEARKLWSGAGLRGESGPEGSNNVRRQCLVTRNESTVNAE